MCIMCGSSAYTGNETGIYIDQAFVCRIKDTLYNGRVDMLHKVIQHLTRNKHLLNVAIKYPFLNQVIHLSKNFRPLTDDEQNAAIDTVLSSEVYDRVKDEEMKQDPNYEYVEVLVKQLLRWFKEEFFTWVNKLDCPNCGNKEQEQIRHLPGLRPYKYEHFQGKATIIERYQCLKCLSTYEFPRYNDIRTLLKTRKGRCGEWNNCFIAILKSLDIDTRFIWNAEDHVWCEYYNEREGRWIHLDSCENSYDQPYLYNEGWGKKMSYTFAIGPNYIIDVSDKYLSPNRPENHLPRNKCPEVSLKGILAHHNAQSILASSKDTILRTTSQLIADLMNARGKVHPVHTETTSTNEGASLLPRQSGAGAWTRQRGEDNNE